MNEADRQRVGGLTALNSDTINSDLLEFLAASPTPFHAVATMAKRLSEHGFERLDEAAAWNLQPGRRYYVSRNDSSIIAFRYGRTPLAESGIRMVGAHTDSPCLKVKPQPELRCHGYYQLGVEVYGGVLLNPWFDRDLSLAGRVSFRNPAGKVESCLLDFARPVAVIPSLAIHLDREANKQRSINEQTDIPPLLMLAGDERKPDFRALLLGELRDKKLATVEQVLDYELCFYDTQAPALTGLKQEFIASARLDNLLSCYLGMIGMIAAEGDESCLLVCNDHEEVGSRSSSGAQGPMLLDFLSRLLPDAESRLRCLNHSLLISADNAHGIHPNYSARHDANHGPLLNSGPVIKINANQSYASNSETAALFRNWCQQLQVPVQCFVTRTDMACGSTIGPITAAQLGIRTLDVGLPTFAMHSIRELAGARDTTYFYTVLQHFFATEVA